MVYGWIDRYDDLVNQCRGSPFFCHPDIPLLLLVQTKSGITKKRSRSIQSIHERTPFFCRFGPFCSVPRMQDYQQSGFIEYEKDSIRFYGHASSLLLHKRQGIV